MKGAEADPLPMQAAHLASNAMNRPPVAHARSAMSPQNCDSMLNSSAYAPAYLPVPFATSCFLSLTKKKRSLRPVEMLKAMLQIRLLKR